jgi:UDP-3-O-acyl N-acetylglucosamine deacetylase
MQFRPAPPNTGIVFSRSDMPGAGALPALASSVVDVRRGTTISNGKAFVVTVEHVLATFASQGIDNAYVDMDGPEPPVADGSALSFLRLVDDAGIEIQDELAICHAPKDPVIIENGDSKLIVVPYDGLKITCIVSYGATPLDAQYFSMEIDDEVFRREIASSRTFCQFRELEQLIAMGLVKGGSLDNAVVLHDGAIISNNGLRYPNELVRHKVLDIIGDISLIGCRLKAHIIAIKPGHPTNIALAQEILRRRLQS